MNPWLLTFGVLYLCVLVALGYSSYAKTRTAEDYIMGGSNFGFVIGMLTFAATLFSTFTFMGMPDFFRTHGIGSWIFLAVSDAVMFFVILWFGARLRARTKSMKYQGISGILMQLYQTPWAGYLYLTGVFLFLVPYVAIQIRGVSIFLAAMFPEALPAWGWSVLMVIVMLSYSEFGGLRAIVFIDVFQGILLLLVIWIIAYNCIEAAGGTAAIFTRAAAAQPALMSVPGPQGLFSRQFLLVSLISIVLIPVTQPQVLTRLIIIRSDKTLRLMAVGLGIFAFVLILATLFIGLYGAIYYRDADTAGFLAGVMLHEQSDMVAALVVVGLLAAATSTADSQLFALGTEIRSVFMQFGSGSVDLTRGGVFIFGLLALGFAIASNNQLVLLARLSLTGTALLGPMVIAAIAGRHLPARPVLVATAAALVLFAASLAGVIPDMYLGFRLDLLLLVALAVFGAGTQLYGFLTAQKKTKSCNNSTDHAHDNSQ